ncbi:acyl carrier protein [Streptomyces sp. M19]
MSRRAPGWCRRRGLERELTEVWCAVLGAERIGRTQRFLDLGGDSIAAIRIVGAVEERLGMTVSVRVLLETQTIAGMAAHLRRRPGRTGTGHDR